MEKRGEKFIKSWVNAWQFVKDKAVNVLYVLPFF